MDTKRCSKCESVKSLDDFGPDKRASTGRQAQCKSCQRSYDLERYRTDPNRNAKAKERSRNGASRRYRANPGLALAKSKEYRTRLKLEVLAHYGGKCACCSVTESIWLTIDHVDGGGAEHRKALPS